MMGYVLDTVKVRFVGEPAGETIAGPASAVAVLRDVFAGLDADREHFVILACNANLTVTGFKVVSTGGVSASLVDAKTLFRDALALGAVSLILAHNHPSGDATPSREDITLTKRLKQGGDLLDIPIHDHVILGDGSFVSLAERGIL